MGDALTQDLSGAVDDTHGLLTGDLDADGDAKIMLLGACGHLGRHIVRVYDAWATDRFADLALQGPVHGALADLDGVAPPELVSATWGCNEQRAAPTRGLRVFRHDPAARAMRPIAARITTGGTREFGLVEALDVTGSAAHEVLACTVPAASAPPRAPAGSSPSAATR